MFSPNIITDAVRSSVEGAANQVVGATIQTGTNMVSNALGSLGSMAGLPGNLLNSATSSLLGAVGSGPLPLPNPLNLYASYNYIFTLSPLSNHEINFPESTYRINTPSGVILKSGGSGSKKITGDQEKSLGIATDLYIDDVEIKTLAGANSDTRFTTGISVDFTVIEPYSMGMFLENLKEAAKTKGFPNYINAPFLLTLEFIGWDDRGNLLKIPNTKRMIPIKLIDAQFKVDNSGSRYTVKAIVWQDEALADEVQSVKTDSDLEGETINEMLQTGPKSLATLLNTREQKLKNDGHKAEANEYVILFPVDRVIDTGDTGTDNTGATTSGKEDEFVRQIFGTKDTPSPSGSPEAEKEKILGFELTTGTIGDKLRDYALDESNVNDIGKSKISKGFITQGTPYYGRAAFVENEDEPGTFKRDKIVASADGTRLNFKRGERIQDIIEEVLLLSEYGRKFPTEKEDENGMKPWFKIETNVYLGDASDGMVKTGDKPKVYVYKVIPYKFNTATHKSPSVKAPGIEALKSQAVKEYNYIYTGKNDSIINFDIEINYAYMTSLQSDLTDFANTTVLDSNEDLISDEGEEDAEFTVGEPSELAGEGSPSVVQSSHPSTGATGGGSKNHTESAATRNLSDIITNGTDLLQLDLTIWGDPYFMSDTGMGNYTAKETQYINLTADGTMDYQLSEVDVIVNFRTPVDYDQNGVMQFPGGDTSPVYNFSGLYRVFTILNKFSQGQFTQELSLIRRHNQDDSTSGGMVSPVIQDKESSKEGSNTSASSSSSSPLNAAESAEMQRMTQSAAATGTSQTTTMGIPDGILTPAELTELNSLSEQAAQTGQTTTN